MPWLLLWFAEFFFFPRGDPADLFPLLCTGIGKAIAKKLALQGLNVVMVAFPDDTLDAAFAELKEAYPKVQFKKVQLGMRSGAGV